MKNPKRTRVATGIYRDACGFLATASCRRLRRDHRFPPDTAIAFMESWRIRTRAELDEEHTVTVTRRRIRIAPGIYRDQYGLAATVKVGRVQREHRFPAEEALATIKAWQANVRAELFGLVADAALARTLPTEDWKRLKPSPDGWCYVYFVRAGDRIKIGRATDPCQRFRGLQTAHPEALSLVLSIPAHAALEGAIHDRFAHLKERGEWFRVEPDLVAFIEAVQAGANPITLLW
jgi:hypothetical protein